VRKAKSSAQVSMKTAVERLVVRDTQHRVALLQDAEADLVNAGVVTGDLVLEVGEPAVEATLAEQR
jgi:hypothetical protein